MGVLRLRPGRPTGAGGVQSITDKLGTSAFPRLRFGIGKYAGDMDPADYVLEVQARRAGGAQDDPGPGWINALCFVREGLERAMNQYNGEVG